MGKRNKVVVAMSGGVDSSVAACLLHEQGFEVVGFFMRIGDQRGQAPQGSGRHQGCCSAADAADARVVAGKLGINFYALNFQQDFDQIIDYFAQEYKVGRTPNPCVVCNSDLKFGKLLDYARSIDADWIATGHYARVERGPDRTVLRQAVDETKDQTYVLFGLDRSILDRVLFPLGELTKEQVRERARSLALAVSEKPDSVELCFVPDRDYARVVRAREPGAFTPGEVVDGGGTVVGRHQGLAQYTIGQRRGLGIAFGLPIYVTGLDATTNRVTVGPREDLLHRELLAEGANWLMDPPDKPLRVTAKIRYQHRAAAATVQPLDDQRWRVAFDEPQSAITPGQAVVLYDGDICLGGAWIREALAGQ